MKKVKMYSKKVSSISSFFQSIHHVIIEVVEVSVKGALP